MTLCQRFNPFTQSGCDSSHCFFTHISLAEARHVVSLAPPPDQKKQTECQKKEAPKRKQKNEAEGDSEPKKEKEKKGKPIQDEEKTTQQAREPIIFPSNPQIPKDCQKFTLDGVDYSFVSYAIIRGAEEKLYLVALRANPAREWFLGDYMQLSSSGFILDVYQTNRKRHLNVERTEKINKNKLNMMVCAHAEMLENGFLSNQMIESCLKDPDVQELSKAELDDWGFFELLTKEQQVQYQSR